MIISEEEKNALMDARNELSDFVNTNAGDLVYYTSPAIYERLNKVLEDFDKVITKWSR